MKRVLLCTMLFSATIISAQEQGDDKLTIEKGTWVAAGSLSLRNEAGESSFSDENFTQNSDRDVFSIAFFPRVGYAFGENWIVGALVSYSLTRSDNESVNNTQGVINNESKFERVSLSPYVRRYFGITKNLALYAQGEAGVSRGWTEDTRDNEDRRTSTQNGFFVNLRPGISFFASKNLAFESSIGVLGYSFEDSENSFGNEAESGVFNLNVNSTNLLFGLSYFF
ncbi:MAG: outer membrane beta-barrel protein [Bacteroidota bacterium]